MTGTLGIDFNRNHGKGFQFIHGDDGQDYFSHVAKYADFDGGDSDVFRSMAGTKVRFDVVSNPKGPRAEHVEAV